MDFFRFRLLCPGVVISLRKCARRRAALSTGRRNGAHEVAWPAPVDGAGPRCESFVREPTPDEAATLAETVAGWLRGLGPSERAIMELDLQGLSFAEIAVRLHRSERTV